MSEAYADIGYDDDAVHYHFPVEVEVRGGSEAHAAHYHFPVEVEVATASAAHAHDVVAMVLDRLATELGA